MRPLFGEGDRLEELNIVVVGYVVTTRSQPKGDDAATDIVEPVRPVALPAALHGTPRHNRPYRDVGRGHHNRGPGAAPDGREGTGPAIRIYKSDPQ
jgi:hypothetical protein